MWSSSTSPVARRSSRRSGSEMPSVRIVCYGPHVDDEAAAAARAAGAECRDCPGRDSSAIPPPRSPKADHARVALDDRLREGRRRRESRRPPRPARAGRACRMCFGRVPRVLADRIRRSDAQSERRDCNRPSGDRGAGRGDAGAQGCCIVRSRGEIGANSSSSRRPSSPDGRLVGRQRKRHLGEDEVGYSVGTDELVFELGSRRVGIVICAEGGVDFTWDRTVAAGAEVVAFCSAPGLYGRCTDEAAWPFRIRLVGGARPRSGRRHASRLHVAIAMSTQAGATGDEDFPVSRRSSPPKARWSTVSPTGRPGILIVEM